MGEVILGYATDWDNGNFGLVSYWDVSLPISIADINTRTGMTLKTLYQEVEKYDGGLPNTFLGQIYSKTFQTYEVCLYDVVFNEGFYGENAFIESINSESIQVSTSGLKTFFSFREKEADDYWFTFYNNLYNVRERIFQENQARRNSE